MVSHDPCEAAVLTLLNGIDAVCDEVGCFELAEEMCVSSSKAPGQDEPSQVLG